MWAYFLTSKDETLSTVKEFRQQIEMELRIRIRMLRIDRGGEFTSNEFTKYCKEKGIARQLTAPYSPQQNEVVERRNKTVLSTTRRVEEGSKACRLYDPIAKKKHVSRDVKFMETKPWDWNEDGEDTGTQDIFWASFVVEGVDNENTTPVNTEINDNNDDTYQEPDLINDLNSPITPPTYTYNPYSEEEEEATTSSIEKSKKGFDHVPVRGFKKLTDIYQNT
uniref:Zinc finger, CCHC-type n=1 Tax=Tanacetum cinerariifolium TaxID=118510 RepID=A0A699PXA4_TANCI|nr:zinc finger, CCHC-type [Tanacetum cinerariifolium]